MAPNHGRQAAVHAGRAERSLPNLSMTLRSRLDDARRHGVVVAAAGTLICAASMSFGINWRSTTSRMSRWRSSIPASSPMSAIHLGVLGGEHPITHPIGGLSEDVTNEGVVLSEVGGETRRAASTRWVAAHSPLWAIPRTRSLTTAGRSAMSFSVTTRTQEMKCGQMSLAW
jgi:hypothetical protein